MVAGKDIPMPIFLLLFFGTIAEYSIDLQTHNRIRARQMLEKDYLLLFSLPVCCISFWFLSWQQQLFFLHLATLGVGYTLPIFGKPLRDVPFVKMWLIVYAWVGSVFVLPLIGGTWHLHTLLMLSERLLFFLCIAISFDIRDIESDQRAGVATTANKLGRRKSVGLSLVAGLAGTLVSVVVYPLPLAAALSASYLLSWLLVAAVKPGQNPLFSNFLVDGTLTFQSLMIGATVYFL